MINEHYSHNMAVINVALQDYTERVVKERIRKMCNEVADEFMLYIDNAYESLDGPVEQRGNSEYPAWSDNMHDSTGIGVYNDGMLTAYIPTKRADQPQFDSKRELYDIWGTSYLQRALTDSAKYNKGIWVVLFCAVPYAIDVNNLGSPKGRGEEFFERFSKTFRRTIEERVRAL